jgi:hypothetical protein
MRAVVRPRALLFCCVAKLTSQVTWKVDNMADSRLTDGAGREITFEQLETWVVAQTVRNELEMFHGGGAIDPEHPERDEGFITDAQMKALSIVIRHAVHEALTMLHAMGQDGETAKDAINFCMFQMATVHDYMETPGSRELEKAYQQVKRKA